MEVIVRDNNINQAYRTLKKKLHNEGVIKELMDRTHYTKPSETRRKKKLEAIRRTKKELQKRKERDNM